MTIGLAFTASNIQYSDLAFGSISGSYATLITLTQDAYEIRFTNQTDAAILVSFNGGSTNHILVRANTDYSVINLIGLGLSLASGASISIAHAGVAPTVGRFSVTVLR